MSWKVCVSIVVRLKQSPSDEAIDINVSPSAMARKAGKDFETGWVEGHGGAALQCSVPLKVAVSDEDEKQVEYWYSIKMIPNDRANMPMALLVRTNGRIARVVGIARLIIFAKPREEVIALELELLITSLGLPSAVFEDEALRSCATTRLFGRDIVVACAINIEADPAELTIIL